MKHDPKSKDMLIHTIKEHSGPLKESLKYSNDLVTILQILQATYINGTEGLETLLDMEDIKKRQPLDYGASFMNINFFLARVRDHTKTQHAKVCDHKYPWDVGEVPVPK